MDNRKRTVFGNPINPEFGEGRMTKKDDNESWRDI